MPTYEYECDNCNIHFEKFQSIKSDPIRICPECGSNKVRRLISPGAGFLFKGSGFYITDYRSKEYKDKAKQESSSSKIESPKIESTKKEDTKSSTVKKES